VYSAVSGTPPDRAKAPGVKLASNLIPHDKHAAVQSRDEFGRAKPIALWVIWLHDAREETCAHGDKGWLEP
jgi:hypothetical protein